MQPPISEIINYSYDPPQKDGSLAYYQSDILSLVKKLNFANFEINLTFHNNLKD